jgi:hypothetical protein
MDTVVSIRLPDFRISFDLVIVELWRLPWSINHSRRPTTHTIHTCTEHAIAVSPRSLWNASSSRTNDEAWTTFRKLMNSSIDKIAERVAMSGEQDHHRLVSLSNDCTGHCIEFYMRSGWGNLRGIAARRCYLVKHLSTDEQIWITRDHNRSIRTDYDSA